MKTKLKTKKQLLEMGYEENKKSIFAPLSIDLTTKDNKRSRDNMYRIISPMVFKLLGKEVEITGKSMWDGVEIYTLNHGGMYFYVPAAITELSVEKYEKLQAIEAAKKAKMAAKAQLMLDKYSLKKVTSGNYTLMWDRKLKRFKINCQTIDKKQMREIIKFASRYVK